MRVSMQLLSPTSWLPRRVREASRLLQVAGLVLTVTAIWYAINIVRPTGPEVLLWIPSLISVGIVIAMFFRTARAQRLPQPARQFWGRLTVAAVLVGFGCTAQTVDVLTHPGVGGPHNIPVMLGFDTAAIIVIIYALQRLPLKQQTPGELIRVVLDAGTVMLATALFIWHFQARSSLDAEDGGAVLASLVLTALVLVVVLAVAKVVLSRYVFIDKSALRLLALAMAIGALGPPLQSILGAGSHLVSTQLIVPATFFVATWAGERQLGMHIGPRRGAPEPVQRPFSLMPYAAVAAVDGLLVAVTRQPDGGDELIVVVGAVLLTGLVVLRQIIAFRENGRLLARLDHGATHDSLTQLPNRALFAERLHKALTTPGSRPVCVALIDLDDFKEVNDTLGHEIGDLLLVAVAQRLNACVRIEDTVARLGGDEFVVVLDGADPAAADLAAERMVAALEQPVMADGHELPIRASIGIADGHTGDEASVLLRHADIAMYAAKNVSGTAYLHYEGAMAATVTDHAHLGAELRIALANADDQLFLLYQPIVSLADGHVVGAEALVRWQHPERGILPPDLFIPVAERTGMIVALGRWVVREACRQLAAWISEYGDAAPTLLNVNISARDLREVDFAADVAAALDEFGLDGDRLVLEVTETMVVELGTSVTNLEQLRTLGVRVSLDDFGTGHSTLTLLHNCPVDEIKLDRSFVQAELNGRPTVAAAVMHLAQGLGLHVVAEGVETAEQAELLLSLGYSAAQGYHFARPMRPADLGEVLRDRRSLAPQAWHISV